MMFTPRGLMITSVVVGAVAVATLALSVATDAWLFTTEIMENMKENQTEEITVYAQMGLWKVCMNYGKCLKYLYRYFIFRLSMFNLLEQFLCFFLSNYLSFKLIWSDIQHVGGHKIFSFFNKWFKFVFV